MKISYNWLKQFIDFGLPVEEVAGILTDIGLEVEDITLFESIKGGLKGVVVGEVIDCNTHPNADRLKLTTVKTGNTEPLQIVCGAPNVTTGQKVAVALIGTVLFDENDKSFKIKKGRIRGEESFGMICAEDELGIGKSHDGIMVLDNKWKPGTALSEVLELEHDYRIEIGLTPNRSDAMGHFGVARDLRAALLQRKEKNFPLKTDYHKPLAVDNENHKVSITIDEEQACLRYAGITLEDITVKASPKWLENRLKAIGLSPVNNIVDATNYVLHELGHPLHAFDLDSIENNQIKIRKAYKGEKITLLDGKEYTLDSNDLLISDEKKPLCLAGVFGGLNSSIKDSTTKIFLESAYFNPTYVRRTAKKHTLNTDASFRFERGVDPAMVTIALKKAAQLIRQLAGAKIASPIIDVYPNPIKKSNVKLKYNNVTDLLGESIAEDTIIQILSSLDIFVDQTFQGGVILQIPLYRTDVKREADVIEEILRIYGYNKIAIPTKLNSSIPCLNESSPLKIQEKTANHLASIGFNEMLNNSLEKRDYNRLSQKLKPENTVSILNPLSLDLNALRQSLLWSGLEAINRNINHKNTDLKLFEFGKTYHHFKAEYAEYKEFQHLSLFMTGRRLSENWINNKQVSDYYYSKGIVENILKKLKINDLDYYPLKNDIFSEGIRIDSNKKIAVELGVINKAICEHFNMDQTVVFADFNWDNILSLNKDGKTTFKNLPKFPSARRDLALLLDNNVNFKDLYQTALQTERKLLKKVNLFDVYHTDKLSKGKKSYALSFELYDENKTITEKQIEKTMQKLTRAFEQKFNAVLRS